MRRIFAAALLVAAFTACIDSVEPLPLDITIQAPATATTADSVTLLVNAQGNTLIGVETSWGDGTTTSFPTGGARTAKLTFRHLYTVSGAYQVTATVTDVVLGEKSASAQVNVQ